MIRKLFVFMTVLWICAGCVAQLRAIPAFARRYKISCSTCHAPFPKLKEYGADFAADAMILKEEEKERDYISAGDDLLWLNRTFPVAVRFEAFGLYDPDSDIETDLQSPWGLKLLSGGTLYKNIGYYFYFYMYEGGEVAGIEDAYVHFDRVFGTNLDIMLGQFQTSDPLMKRELRLTYDDYMIYKYNTEWSQTDLTYDRGIMLVYTIEQTGTELVGQIVNGNGKPEAGDDGKLDQDNYKNLGFRIRQDAAGLFSIGGYYYQGTEILETGGENKITYWGPDFNAAAGPLELTVQYLEREDKPSQAGPAIDVKTKGTVVEAIWSPKLDKSRYFVTALYNKIDSEPAVYRYETMTLGATWLLARNLRLTAEYTRDLEREKNRFVVGMVSGF